MSELTTDTFYKEIGHAAQTAAPLFRLYGWTYGDGVPDINELEDTITRLVDETIEAYERRGGDASVSTGRFIVRLSQYKEERELTIDLNLAASAQFKDFSGEWQ